MKNFILWLILTMISFKSFSQEKNVWPRDRYAGPGGGLYTGPGGGLYAGPCEKSYKSNQPPREALLNYLRANNMTGILKILKEAGF